MDEQTSTSYPLFEETQRRLDNTFTYHAPRADQPQRYEALRSQARALAESICRLTPSSREQSLALTKLEEAIFWANAAIARNEGQSTLGATAQAATGVAANVTQTANA